MAGEISTAGIKVLFAPESSIGVRPSTGWAEKAASGTLTIAEYITGISGLGADYDMYDVTPLAETERHRFTKGLQNNDGSISMDANINPTSRADWALIVAAYNTLQTTLPGGALWFAFQLPGDTQAFYVRGEPLPMRFPDVAAASAVQGAIQIVENECDEWQTAPTV